MLQEDIDAYVDLKGVSQLYSVEVKLILMMYNPHKHKI